MEEAVATLAHRGPDGVGTWAPPSGGCAMAHRRLAIIDLSEAGKQPMVSLDGRLAIVFNGEIYNYLELRRELESGWAFRTRTDTEVLLAAYARWGASCLDRFVGMFAFAVWDEREGALFAARDRFGVKPLYVAELPGNRLAFASEIKALHAVGLPREPDGVTWATYLTYGLYDHSERTFWRGVRSLPPGHTLRWKDGQMAIGPWYDVAQRAGVALDPRPEDEVLEEYRALLEESVALRFRADVPVGVNLSGGLDSSTLLAAVHAIQGPGSDVSAFTFVTGDPQYDELPWVREMLEATCHPHHICPLSPEEVPELAERVA
ncbi:MAG: asparagine synthase (glutamine-hydrolyzing), partial [Chloroflexia bacterium]